MEKDPPLTSSDYSASSDSSGAGYYIDFRSGRPQMRCIRRPMRGPYPDP